AKFIRTIARARPTSKGTIVDHQNHDFLPVQWLINSMNETLFFSAGEREMIMNAYEEYKTIIMAKSNTATAVRAREEAVDGAVYGVIFMYVLTQPSVRVVGWVEEMLNNLKVASSILSVVLHFLVS